MGSQPPLSAMARSEAPRPEARAQAERRPRDAGARPAERARPRARHAAPGLGPAGVPAGVRAGRAPGSRGSGGRAAPEPRVRRAAPRPLTARPAHLATPSPPRIPPQLRRQKSYLAWAGGPGALRRRDRARARVLWALRGGSGVGRKPQTRAARRAPRPLFQEPRRLRGLRRGTRPGTAPGQARPRGRGRRGTSGPSRRGCLLHRGAGSRSGTTPPDRCQSR